MGQLPIQEGSDIYDEEDRYQASVDALDQGRLIDLAEAVCSRAVVGLVSDDRICAQYSCVSDLSDTNWQTVPRYAPFPFFSIEPVVKRPQT